MSLASAHFWGMDEWFDTATGKEVPVTHPLSFERADREMCFGRIPKKLRMPETNLHFPKGDTAAYRAMDEKRLAPVIKASGARVD